MQHIRSLRKVGQPTSTSNCLSHTASSHDDRSMLSCFMLQKLGWTVAVCSFLSLLKDGYTVTTPDKEMHTRSSLKTTLEALGMMQFSRKYSCQPTRT